MEVHIHYKVLLCMEVSHLLIKIVVYSACVALANYLFEVDQKLVGEGKIC